MKRFDLVITILRKISTFAAAETISFSEFSKQIQKNNPAIMKEH